MKDGCVYLYYDPGNRIDPTDSECRYQESRDYRERPKGEQELVDWILDHIECDCSKCPFETEPDIPDREDD